MSNFCGNTPLRPKHVCRPMTSRERLWYANWPNASRRSRVRRRSASLPPPGQIDSHGEYLVLCRNRPAHGLNHVDVAIAVARIEGLYGDGDRELAVPGMAGSLAARRVADGIAPTGCPPRPPLSRKRDPPTVSRT
jgi:hypothetical protein